MARFTPAMYPTATMEFLQDSTARLRTPASRKAYKQHLRLLQSTYDGKRVGQFTEADLLAWLNQTGLSTATVAQRRKIARKFFEWAAWKGYVTKDPAQHLNRLVPTPNRPVMEHRWLTKDEVHKLLDAVGGEDLQSNRDRTVLMLGLFTGLRASELAAVKWGDVSSDARTLRVTGKGQKLAVVALPPQLISWLAIWKSLYAAQKKTPVTSEDPVIIGFRTIGLQDRRTEALWGSGVGSQAIRGIVAHRGSQAGFPGLAPHDLRRTFAGLLESQGKTIHEISMALRHSNVATTQAYMERSDAKTIAVTADFSI